MRSAVVMVLVQKPALAIAVALIPLVAVLISDPYFSNKTIPAETAGVFLLKKNF